MSNDEDGFNTEDLDAYLEDALTVEMVKPITALYKAFKAQGLSIDEAAVLATTFLVQAGKQNGSE